MFDFAKRAIVVLEDGVPSVSIREDWASPMRCDVCEKYGTMIRHLADHYLEHGHVEGAKALRKIGQVAAEIATGKQQMCGLLVRVAEGLSVEEAPHSTRTAAQLWGS